MHHDTVLRIDGKTRHMAHHVRGKFGSESTAVLIAPEQLRRSAVFADAHDAEVGFGVRFHVFEILARTRYDKDFTD